MGRGGGEGGWERLGGVQNYRNEKDLADIPHTGGQFIQSKWAVNAHHHHHIDQDETTTRADQVQETTTTAKPGAAVDNAFTGGHMMPSGAPGMHGAAPGMMAAGVGNFFERFISSSSDTVKKIAKKSSCDTVGIGVVPPAPGGVSGAANAFNGGHMMGPRTNVVWPGHDGSGKCFLNALLISSTASGPIVAMIARGPRIMTGAAGGGGTK